MRLRLARGLHLTMNATSLALKGAVRICADQEGLQDAAKALEAGTGTGQDTPAQRDIARMIASGGGFGPRTQTILSVTEYRQPETLAAEGAHGRQP